MSAMQRIYKDMTPNQLAIVSVNATLDGDDETPREILAYVPRKTYSQPDIHYSDLAQFLEGMTIALTADYYYAATLHASILVEMMRNTFRPGTIDTDDAAIEGNADHIKEMVEAANHWKDSRDMVDHFATVICKETGLDEVIVRKRAKFPAKGPEGFPECLSPKLRREYDEMLSGFRENFQRYAA